MESEVYAEAAEGEVPAKEKIGIDVAIARLLEDQAQRLAEGRSWEDQGQKLAKVFDVLVDEAAPAKAEEPKEPAGNSGGAQQAESEWYTNGGKATSEKDDEKEDKKEENGEKNAELPIGELPTATTEPEPEKVPGKDDVANPPPAPVENPH